MNELCELKEMGVRVTLMVAVFFGCVVELGERGRAREREIEKSVVLNAALSFSLHTYVHSSWGPKPGSGG